MLGRIESTFAPRPQGGTPTARPQLDGSFRGVLQGRIGAPPPEPSAPTLSSVGQGDRDTSPDGPIRRLQAVLKRWNPRLELQPSGSYDEHTRRAVQLFKAVYGTGMDGRSMDAGTADIVQKMENGSFWSAPAPKSAAGRVIHAASQDLGKPYRMGGDGVTSTDCAMLTRRALVRAGVADADLTRLADQQLRDAERGSNGLQRITAPKPGDLVFFNHRTSQSNEAYKGVTHVGILLGGGLMLAASSGQGKVVIQEVGGHVAGFARAAEAIASR